VPAERAEQARARMLELFPDGFEERDSPDGDVELVAYTDGSGEERLWQAFGGARGEDVAEDWAERWRRFHQPAQLGSMWIGPPWRDPPPDLLTIVIDPGRAFGTGSHATTRLCLELLESVGRGSLLDIGCGSGVLSIAAAKLGFDPVVALDADANAVEATSANAAANGVTVDVRSADAATDELPSTDVAVSNITLELVETVLARLRAPLVITSGYVSSEQPRTDRYRSVKRLERDGWAADLLELAE
jgi:ribosomal protein L11 methyltransferase